jgi:hypothetical protein
MQTREELTANVNRGITLLNEKVPGWLDKIKYPVEIYGSTGCCVLQQIFNGDYLYGSASLQIDPLIGEAIEYGFNAKSLPEYPLIDEIWNNRISEMRAASL